MRFTAAVITCLHKFAVFDGRATRSEFWYFILFWILVAMACAARLEFPQGPVTWAGVMHLLRTAPPLLVPVALFVPMTAVAVRRLHDIGISGWWLLTGSIPVPVLDLVVVGAQVLCFLRPGIPGENRYGPDPLASR